MNKKHHWSVAYWIMAIFLLLSLQSIWQGFTQTEPVPYSEFENALAQGRIKDVVISEKTITGQLKNPDGKKTTLIATRVEPDLATRLDKYHVPYTRVVENTLLKEIISWVAPALVFFGIWYFLIRRLSGQQGVGGML